MKVHILVTCRNPELIGASTMVFDTIRVGFPTARFIVWRNDGDSFDGFHKELDRYFDKSDQFGSLIPDATCRHVWNHGHGPWIEHLVETEQEPFWICDTDVVFFQSVEGFETRSSYAGRFIPRYRCEFANAVTEPRIHPSLMLIDPSLVRLLNFPDSTVDKFLPPMNLFNPVRIRRTMQEDHLFFDCCAGLYAATYGHHFGPDMLQRYGHMFCGTISDLVAPRLSGDASKMHENNLACIANPELLRGAWRQQDEYFKARAVE
jgi:hypothetical protein